MQAIVEYYRLGLSTSEILGELPFVTEAQLYDLLSYFYDHKEEILEGIDKNHKFVEKHNKKHTQKGVANV